MSSEILILFLPSLLSKIRLYFPLRFKKKKIFYLFNFFFSTLFCWSQDIAVKLTFFHILTHICLFLNPYWLRATFDGSLWRLRPQRDAFYKSFPVARCGLLRAADHCPALSRFLGVYLHPHTHLECPPCVKHCVMHVAPSRKGSREKGVVSRLGTFHTVLPSANHQLTRWWPTHVRSSSGQDETG